MCGTPRAAMTPLAHLLLVLLAACAAAAAPAADLADLDLEDPLDKDVTPEIIAVNDLRVKPVDIPVEIIEDSRPAIKTNEVADDDEEIKRPSIDLRNPGPPQRQEHETQNADHFPDVQKLSTVRETILQTQDLLRQGIQGIGDDITNWLSTDEQVNPIQENIQSLRDTFTIQIQKLNEAVKGLAAPQPLRTEKIPESKQTSPNLKKVEASIHTLENNLDKGMRALSEGVSIVAILRAEDENAAAVDPAPAPVPAPAPAQSAPPSSPVTVSPPNVVLQFISNLQSSVSDSIRNMTEALNNVPAVQNIQNFLNPTASTPATGVLADSPEGTTPRPANNPWSWPFPNIQNIFSVQSPGQSGTAGQPPAAAPGAIATGFQNLQIAFQNNPIVQGITGLVTNNTPKPNDDKKPETLAVTAAPSAVADNVAAAPSAAAGAAVPAGPIRQILSNNPVVQSIAGTVQRIQSSINNPETPRDTEKSEDLETKGGGYYGGNRPNVSGG